MNITVRLFGPQAQRTGRRSVDVDVLDTPVTVAGVRKAVAHAVPELGESLGNSRFAVNSEIVGEDAVVSREDEIALIGMLGGG